MRFVTRKNAFTMSHWTLVVSVLCSVGVGISALSGTGYYCRDPDTGKLYPGNSTWPSASFCGNYTCKLRKKVFINTEAPLREFSIINTINKTTSTAEPKNSEKYKEQTEETKTEKITTNDYLSIITTLNPTYFSVLNNKLLTTTSDPTEQTRQKDAHDDIENKQITISTEQGDRYLTETEIKTISKILHNVKKSDFEAIIDIYNLAQDIYKEMDKITSENVVEETIKAAKTPHKDSGNKHYWYEPLNRLKSHPDMEFQGSNPYPSIAERSTIEPNTYFQGPLAKTDFGALPYYYPMSNFQRQSSYVHLAKNAKVGPTVEKPTCPQKTPAPTPSYHPFNHVPSYGAIIKKPYAEAQKLINPSVLLPYPFSYVQNYNMSGYPESTFNNGNPWNIHDIKKNNDNYYQYFKRYLPKPKVSENTILPNIDSKRHQTSKKDDLDTKVYSGKSLFDTLFDPDEKKKSKPLWQTNPLSASILEEIKAHVDEKAILRKPLSIRNTVKLERVGKVVKLDELKRDKRNMSFEVRSTEAIDDGLETYLEKTTCRAAEDPGFYKMGNQSESYPACCPQRIEDQR